MSSDFFDVRREYLHGSLDESEMAADPLLQFELWLNQATHAGLDLPNAMVLATATAAGIPSARYVLLKGFSDTGFVFFTNTSSLKGRQLQENPHASLLFYWSPMDRQVRIEGTVSMVEQQEADDYFSSRPYDARINTWVAPQSSVVENRAFLEQRRSLLQDQYNGADVPRPVDWSGYRVFPVQMEFWQGRENRLHDRILYQRENGERWSKQRLAP